MIRCVITDFDGTLLDDNKMISNENLASLEKLRRKKIWIVIATGRSIDSFNKALSDLDMGQQIRDLPLDYVIFSTGAGIMDFPDQNIIYKKSLARTDVGKITRYFDACRFDYMVHDAVPNTGRLLYKSHGQSNPDYEKRLSLYSADASRVDRFDGQFKAATEVLAILPVHEGAKTVAGVRDKLNDFSVIPATSPLDHKSLWIEVFNKNVSKSASSAWLADRLGISPKEVVAIGNDYNDKDLLLWAGKGFVVENAPADLKKKFNPVRSNNHSGVNDVVCRLDLAGLMDEVP